MEEHTEEPRSFIGDVGHALDCVMSVSMYNTSLMEAARFALNCQSILLHICIFG